jgi:2,4-didehydro-3-deoxy-L-rhamnonate hydrolase
MRIATLADRLVLVVAETAGTRAVDVESASRGRFGPDPQGVFDRWEEFTGWASELSVDDAEPVSPFPSGDRAVGAPAPRPRQVFAIGLNYRSHAAESDLQVPRQPPTFTKFPSCLAGPYGDLVLPSGSVDWEVELVAVIGRRADRVAAEDGWSHVAGVAVGQDFSERAVQTAGPAPQFSLGKSFPGFGPFGPCLVTPDELADPDDLPIECTLNGEIVQKDRTSSLLFPVPELVARLSAVCTLYPGDVVFTGTPAGVGMVRTPPRFLQPGDEVVSRIEGVGELRHRCVAKEDH